MTPSRTAEDRLLELLGSVAPRLLPPGQTVLVAASGGRDSMALLGLLARHRDALGIRLVAGTVDHGLRPFHRETALLASWCREALVPWTLEVLPPGLVARARSEGHSLEDQARRERYAALFRLANAAGATRIATAHTRDDQAETVLLRLLRGCGAAGPAGIREAREDGVVRPLLAAPRELLADFAREAGLPWAEDPSNASGAHLRNRIRHDVLPALLSVEASAAAVLARHAAVCADQADGVGAWALEHFGLGRNACLPLLLPASRVGIGPVARARLHALLRVLGAAEGLGAAHLDRLADLAAGPEGREACLAGGLRARRRGDDLCLSRGAWPDAPHVSIPIPGPGRYETPLGVVELTQGSPRDLREPGALRFDADALSFPLLLRPPRRGERLAVFGMAGRTRLVSRLLMEGRVPRHDRVAPRLLVDGDGQLLALIGIRRSEAARVTADTRRVLQLRLEAPFSSVEPRAPPQ